MVRTILEQQVFINEAMEVGLDLALARWNRGPKAEEFFTRMKDDILDGRRTSACPSRTSGRPGRR